MGALIIRRSLTLSLALILSLNALPSSAATAKPAPKVTAKATAKPTATPKVTKKPVAKKPVVKKPAAKKRVVYKRKVVKVSPSPTPGWPPKGFLPDGKTEEIYAKLPTTKELLGVLSANPSLSKQMKACSKFACGAVQVASYPGCTWWEITADVYGPTSDTDATSVPYGNLRTTIAPTNAKQIVTVLLVSTEPLKPKTIVKNINITCYHSPRTELVPTTSYTSTYVAPTPNPTPTPTPTPSS